MQTMWRFAAVAACVGSVLGSWSLEDAYRYGGQFSQLASYSASNTYDINFATASASMRVWKTPAGDERVTTTVKLSGSGLSGITLKAHLHAAPCANDGGGHYMNDPNGAVDAQNENWPEVSCDTAGTCSGEATTEWHPTPVTGLSIVVHDTPTGNSKFLCADLTPTVATATKYSGAPAPLPNYNPAQAYNIDFAASSAGMRVWTTAAGAERTTTTVELRGDANVLTNGLTFNAHLHAKQCADGNGGGHYKHDASGPVDAVNENWPVLTCNQGTCTGTATTIWHPAESAIATGLSIVVHDTPANNDKYICVDLAPAPLGASQYSGAVAAFPTSYYSPSTQYGWDFSASSASMRVYTLESGAERTTTQVSLKGDKNVIGAGTVFKAHLHKGPCAGYGQYFCRMVDQTVQPAQNQMPECRAFTGSWTYAEIVEACATPKFNGQGQGVLSNVPCGQGAGEEISAGQCTFKSGFLKADTRFAGIASTLSDDAQMPTWAYNPAPGNAYLQGVVEGAWGGFCGFAGSGQLPTAPCDPANAPCDFTSWNPDTSVPPNYGSGHYMFDSTGSADAVNENWPQLTCDAEGVCSGEATTNWSPLAADISRGLSIVVHDTPGSTNNNKYICVDLAPVVASAKYTGARVPLTSYTPTNQYVWDFGASSASMQVYTLADGAERTTTQVSLKGDANAIPSGTVFKAHLHAKQCSDGDGGGHYMYDSTGSADAVNENWPQLTCDAGVCTGSATTNWQPSAADIASGLSIVVHDTPAANAKYLCFDLVPVVESIRYNGPTLSVLPSYTGANPYGIDTATASVTMRVWTTATGGERTTTRVEFTGTGVGTSTFKAHLHKQPCANDGGGHYMYDEPSLIVNNMNENWPTLTCSGTTCVGEATTMWQPRAEDIESGLSIVIHDTPSGTGAKFLCADVKLIRYAEGKRYTGVFTELTSTPNAYGIDLGSSRATMRVWLTAKGAERTSTEVAFKGDKTLVGGKTFKAHLHAKKCADQNGGGHYMYDPAGPVNDVNENWPTVSCKANKRNCKGFATTPWQPTEAAIASGLSIVIHDTPSGTGDKFLCADLVEAPLEQKECLNQKEEICTALSNHQLRPLWFQAQKDLWQSTNGETWAEAWLEDHWTPACTEDFSKEVAGLWPVAETNADLTSEWNEYAGYGPTTASAYETSIAVIDGFRGLLVKMLQFQRKGKQCRLDAGEEWAPLPALLEGWRRGSGECAVSRCSAAKETACKNLWKAIPKCQTTGGAFEPCAGGAPDTLEEFQTACQGDFLKYAARTTKWMNKKLTQCAGGASCPTALEPLELQGLVRSFVILAYQAQQTGPDEGCYLREHDFREIATPTKVSGGELSAVRQTLSKAISHGPLAGVTVTRCDVTQDAFATLYVACSGAGQAELDKQHFREGIAAVLNMSTDRIDGISSSPQAGSLVVRFIVGSPGYKAQVDVPPASESCAERWAVMVGLVVTVLFLAVAAALASGVLSCRRHRTDAPGKSAVEAENVSSFEGSPASLGSRTSLEKLASSAPCAPAEMTTTASSE